MPVSSPTSSSDQTSSSDDWSETFTGSTSTESASLLSGESELGAPSKYREQRAQLYELSQHLIHLGGLIGDIGRTLERSEKAWAESEKALDHVVDGRCDLGCEEEGEADKPGVMDGPLDPAILTTLGKCAEGYAEFKLRRFRREKRKQRLATVDHGNGVMEDRSKDELQQEGEREDTLPSIFASEQHFPSILMHVLLLLKTLQGEEKAVTGATPLDPASADQSLPSNSTSGPMKDADQDQNQKRYYPSVNVEDAKVAKKEFWAELNPFLSALHQGSGYLSKLSSAFPDPFAWFTTDPAIGEGIDDAERARKNFHRHLKDALEGTGKKDPRMVMDPDALSQIQLLAQCEEELQQLYWEAAQQQRQARQALTTCAEHLRLYNDVLCGAQLLEQRLQLEAQSLARAAVLHRQAYELGKDFHRKYRPYVKPSSKRKRARETADEASV